MPYAIFTQEFSVAMWLFIPYSEKNFHLKSDNNHKPNLENFDYKLSKKLNYSHNIKLRNILVKVVNSFCNFAAHFRISFYHPPLEILKLYLSENQKYQLIVFWIKSK